MAQNCAITGSSSPSMRNLVWRYGLLGAVEKTRTSTGVSPQRPQRCASTSSATTAPSRTKVGNPFADRSAPLATTVSLRKRFGLIKWAALPGALF